MIDFRYHLVSIIAIFLALSVGIVLGSTFLQDPAIYTAQQTVKGVEQRNTDLQASVTSLQARSAASDEVISAHTPELVDDALNGERVVLVELPGATNADREAVQQVLRQAQAAVSARVAITEKYLDPRQSGLIDQLATAAKPTDLSFPAEATPYDKAATVLASAMVTGDNAQVGRDDAAASGILDAFQKGGLITMSGDPSLRATLAVVLVPAEPFEGEQAEAQNTAVLSLASGLDSAGGGTVVAGPQTAAGPGGVITALRDTGDTANAVSSVDDTDLPMGWLALVLALREQLAGGAGQYGIGTGASAPQPAPTSTSSPTPSETSGG